MARAGEYTERVEIQKNVPALNSSRQKVDDWRLHCIRKARKPRPPRNAPVIITDANRSQIATETLYVRCDSLTSEIDSNFQLIKDGKVCKIESTTKIDDEIEIVCKAREFAK